MTAARRREKWAARMYLILSRFGPMSLSELQAHPKMANCTLGARWLRQRLTELADEGAVRYDEASHRWSAL